MECICNEEKGIVCQAHAQLSSGRLRVTQTRGPDLRFRPAPTEADIEAQRERARRLTGGEEQGVAWIDAQGKVFMIDLPQARSIVFRRAPFSWGDVTLHDEEGPYHFVHW